MSNIIPILQSVDHRLLVVLAAIFAVCAVVAIVKRVAKAAVCLLLIALIAGVLVPTVGSIKEKWNFQWDRREEVIALTIDGEKSVIDLKAINKGKDPTIRITSGLNDEFLVEISYREGKDLRKQTLKMPGFMCKLFKQTLTVTKQPYTEISPQANDYTKRLMGK